ncbi:MAG: anaerobic glycerol-3-phosphate dehydrogenase subunit B [Chloroflexi bacterium]|nr:anaerobic glycerol-3-phosphate dehydrogenase subunit B [Chloroflexota bacterium]
MIVVGAGLAGLFAGSLAAQRGAKTLVVARGIGAMPVGTGCIDVLGYDAKGERITSPTTALPKFIKANRKHPYALAGLNALENGLTALKSMCDSAGYPLVGDLSANHWLPTAVGSIRPTCFAPESFIAGEVRRAEPMTLAALPGFRDFYPHLAMSNLQSQITNYPITAASLSLPDRPTHREAYATDLARLFDDANYRAKVTKAWKGELNGAARVGFPAILGLAHNPAARRDLAERLGAEVFEIPILPPSVPGMRLFNVLREVLQEAGGKLILGPEITGRVDGRALTPRVLGVTGHAAGKSTIYEADRVILATGGFLGGGLISERAGVAAESIFDLPITYSSQPESWFAPRLFGAHPFARFGVRVDDLMRPLDAHGEVMYENLHAVGGLVAGADRLGEGSREGIDVATAWRAIAPAPPSARPDDKTTIARKRRKAPPEESRLSPSPDSIASTDAETTDDTNSIHI